ncbi:hypothetical protein EV360DRAFT_89916 [Lentinula raphanica]|nr:hypothetical protein EV360DRAFT_89916 [Lentinula raphanica]
MRRTDQVLKLLPLLLSTHHLTTIIRTMPAFSRLLALALFFVALILVERPVVARPLSGRSPHDTYSGASAPARGGDVTSDNSNSANDCTGVGCLLPGLVSVGSHNAGDGGETKSGDAMVPAAGTLLKQCKRRPATSGPEAFSGASGDTTGGSSTGDKNPIQVLSDNGGNGGQSVSGESEEC